MPPDPRQQEVPLLFPFQGIDNSQGYDYQRPGTTQDGTNVRTYDSGQDRRRGGSRAGLTPFFGAGSTAQVNGFSVIQSLSTIVTASASATPQPDFTFSPASAYLSGNQFTTITGTGFTGATSVTFGGVRTQWFYVVNDTTIRCSMFPVSSARTVTVVITKADASTVSAPFEFLYAAITGPFTLTASTGKHLVTGCLGSDQKVWAVADPDPIAEISTSNTITYYALSGTAHTNSQATGPDGNIWTVDVVSLIGSTAKYIWKTVPGGASTRYTLETSSNIRYWSIIPGNSDGNLYVFASANSDVDGYVYRVTTAGVVTKSTIISGKNMLGSVMGPDGKVWGIGANYNVTSADLTTWPPAFVEYPRSFSAYNTYNSVVGNDLRIWTTDNGMKFYTFDVADPTKGAYYSSPFFLTNYAQACAGPDGQIWQIDESDPAVDYLVSSDLEGNQIRFGPFVLSSGDVAAYLVLIAGDDGALYCAGFGDTTGSFVKFLG